MKRPTSRRRLRSTRKLRAEALEARYALATYTINLLGDSPDADPGDGVCDVDLATPGEQVTLAAAAQCINADGGGNVLFGIDGTFGGATFTAAVNLDGQQHNVDLNNGLLNLNAGGSVTNLKLAHGGLVITGNNASVQNNLFTAPTQGEALRILGNGATVKTNSSTSGAFIIQGNGATLQTNALSQAGVRIAGDTNTILSNSIYQSPTTGVTIVGSNNRVEANQIGSDGTNDLGNTTDGVLIDGTTLASATNVVVNNLISGNGGNGIVVRGSLASANRLEGNKLGTSSTGTAAIANSLNGILIEDSSNNVIGGTAANTGNLISGNTQSGVKIVGTTSLANSLQSNIIGLNAGGGGVLANGGDGVTISGAKTTAVGVTGGGNIIGGNLGHGIQLSNGATGNLIRAAIIGSNINSQTGLGNQGDGIRIDNATDNDIDGTISRNFIVGNGGAGVFITGNGATLNLVAVNSIGLAPSNGVLANAQGGVTITGGASQNIIGGKAEKRNFISGNGQWGVAIQNASNNQVSGNFIGTNVNGNGAFGANNQPVGVLIAAAATNNLVGVNATGDANLISGNQGHGIEIRGLGTNSNSLIGNVVGLAGDIIAAVSNTGYGILVHDQAAQNNIGNPVQGQASIIAANILGNIAITEQATQNQVRNNIIGFSPSNGGIYSSTQGFGVLIDNANSNTIGDPTGGFVNFIRGHQVAGIRVQNGATLNRLQGNSIVANGDLGISLAPYLADLPRQAVIRQVTLSGTTATVITEVKAPANTTVRVDFYANQAADASGFGEGQLPLAFGTVQVPASGVAQFQFALTITDSSYKFVTAVLTDAAGTTYNFSRAVATTHIVTAITSLVSSTPTNDVQPITLTATLQAASGTPTGNVEFYDGDTLLGTSTIDANRQAKLTAQFAQGQRTITAIYKGTSTNAGMISTPLAITVVQGPPNMPPVANNDTPSVLEDGSVVINVLANDTDPDGGSIIPSTVVITQQPTHGTATVNATTGQITYTPNTNYDGQDTLRYTVKDNRNGTSNAALVTITVTDIPEPWHNKARPADVDNDGFITPSDAAFVITALNTPGAGTLPTPTPGSHPPPFVDVDGDNFLTPLDAALVITALNAAGNGEGEPTDQAMMYYYWLTSAAHASQEQRDE